MKKLYFLNEDEKKRILHMHKESTKKQYLIENKSEILLERGWLEWLRGVRRDDLFSSSSTRSDDELYGTGKRPVKVDPTFRWSTISKTMAYRNKVKSQLDKWFKKYIFNDKDKLVGDSLYKIKKTNINPKTKLTEKLTEIAKRLDKKSTTYENDEKIRQQLRNEKFELMSYLFDDVVEIQDYKTFEMYPVRKSNKVEYDKWLNLQKNNPDRYEFIEAGNKRVVDFDETIYKIEDRIDMSDIYNILDARMQDIPLTTEQVEIINKLKTGSFMAYNDNADSKVRFVNIDGDNIILGNITTKSLSVIPPYIGKVKPQGFQNWMVVRKFAVATPGYKFIIGSAAFLGTGLGLGTLGYIGAKAGVDLYSEAARFFQNGGMTFFSAGYILPADYMDNLLAESCSLKYGYKDTADFIDKWLSKFTGKQNTIVSSLVDLVKKSGAGKFGIMYGNTKEFQKKVDELFKTGDDVCSCANTKMFRQVADWEVGPMFVDRPFTNILYKKINKILQEEKTKKDAQAAVQPFIDKFNDYDFSFIKKKIGPQFITYNIPIIKWKGKKILKYAQCENCSPDIMKNLVQGSKFHMYTMCCNKNEEFFENVTFIIIETSEKDLYFNCKKITKGTNQKIDQILSDAKKYMTTHDFIKDGDVNQGYQKMEKFNNDFQTAIAELNMPNFDNNVSKTDTAQVIKNIKPDSSSSGSSKYAKED